MASLTAYHMTAMQHLLVASMLVDAHSTSVSPGVLLTSSPKAKKTMQGVDATRIPNTHLTMIGGGEVRVRVREGHQHPRRVCLRSGPARIRSIMPVECGRGVRPHPGSAHKPSAFALRFVLGRSASSAEIGGTT